jgi:3-hydroxyisobutyrate dehydrogenase-like beta-hydroxyacid dehydrogenase
MHVGFVGTGNMGRPMAANILKAGLPLTVFDLSAAATSPLERAGATRAADLPTLAGSVRVTLLSLPDARAVEAALFGAPGAPGLMAGAKSGDFIFDLSTVGPASTRSLAARAGRQGVRLVDAPVSGSVSGAEAGTLAVMIGAPEADVKPFEAIFRAIGKNIFCLGEVGKGNILKLLNNYIALTNQAALCEAMALADRLGVARQTVGDVVGKRLQPRLLRGPGPEGPGARARPDGRDQGGERGGAGGVGALRAGERGGAGEARQLGRPGPAGAARYSLICRARRWR